MSAVIGSGLGGGGTMGVGPASQAYGGGDPSMTGPATNRLAAMKAAFHSQYKNQVSYHVCMLSYF